MSKPITIKDIDFDRIDRETIECWVAGDFGKANVGCRIHS